MSHVKSSSGRHQRGGARGRGGRHQGGKQRSATTDLPSNFIQELSKSTAQDEELDKRFAFRGFTKKLVSRKDERKQKRLEKSQRKQQNYGHKKDRQEESHPSPSTHKRKRDNGDASHLPTKKTKTDSSPFITPASLPTPSPSRPTPKEAKKAEKRRLEKLAETNPAFYRMLQEQNLLDGGPSVASGTFAEDDRDIAKYAKLLGIKKKNKKLPGKFTEDGLDYLFEGLMGAEEDGAQGQQMEADDDSESDDDLEEGEEVLEGGLEGTDDEEEDEEDDDDDEDVLDFGDEQSDSEGIDELDMTSEEDESDEGADDDASDDEVGISMEQPFRETKVEVAVAKTTTAGAGKYVPPHLRQQATTKSEQYLRLKRQLQGLLNRLSDANMESILAGVEESYRNHSRHDVTEILTDLIVSYIGDHANLLDSFVMTYAAFIATLGNIIGLEFVAHMVQTVVELLDKSRTEWVESQKDKPDSAEARSKKCMNLVTLLAYLYNFEVVACVIVYDIVRLAIGTLAELDVEILLRILRVCGFQLRTDDPASLKEIVLMVQEAMGKRDADSLSTRAKFMMETIMDLKNNKRKLQKKNADNDMQQDRLKKFMNNLVKKRSLHGTEPLRVSLDDIRSIHTKGKWWLVGAAWVGRQADANGEDAGASAAAVTETVGSASGDLLRLARAQKMNTDDCVDAFERLLKLRLKDKQEREIVRVLIHCSSEEQVFNPYYALVAQKFCDHAHAYKITFQFALWDALKAMAEDAEDDAERMTVRKVSHLARLYAHLIGTGALTLAVLKVLSFTSLSPHQILFCQLLFTTLLTAPAPPQKMHHKQSRPDPDAGIRTVFERITTGSLAEAAASVREGISFFLKQFLVGRQADGIVKAEDREVVNRRVKVARGVLVGDKF
ncbi:suppressor of glycerol defect [Borealophlyctis nickersoniae]|nr:suppressor of glycerol defect [Borealophlyctis nickersoniae]